MDLLFPTGLRTGGGIILQHGEFVQGDLALGSLKLFGGARHQFTVGGHQFFSPSAGLVYGRGRWRARGSVYKAFRAPTLNELFREFRVGNAVPQANPFLTPETLFGFCPLVVPRDGNWLMLRITAYSNGSRNESSRELSGAGLYC